MFVQWHHQEHSKIEARIQCSLIFITFEALTDIYFITLGSSSFIFTFCSVHFEVSFEHMYASRTVNFTDKYYSPIIFLLCYYQYSFEYKCNTADSKHVSLVLIA